jgi:hypothetical protein
MKIILLFASIIFFHFKYSKRQVSFATREIKEIKETESEPFTMRNVSAFDFAKQKRKQNQEIIESTPLKACKKSLINENQ